MRKLLLTGILVASLTGCVRLYGPEDVSRSLSGAAGVDLRQEVGVTVTRSGIWLAKKSLKWSDEEDISLDGLKRVEVGVYEVVGEEEDGRNALSMDRFPSHWMPWVRVHDEGEDVFVLVREGRGGDALDIRSMLVVVAAEDEWVVVRMHGKLEKIMEDAIRFAMDQNEDSDLTEKTIEASRNREG